MNAGLQKNVEHDAYTKEPFDGLRIRGLQIRFRLPHGEILTAVDNVDIDVGEGEVHGLVGESGCGKTVTALSILGLLEAEGMQVDGEISWHGRNLFGLSENELRSVRGRQIAMVFQNASASLNPALRIGNQLKAVLRLHQGLNDNLATLEAERLLSTVRIPGPRRIMRAYAHECSGGMAQRIAIALALACSPRLLIADEPTAALDVTIASQIVSLLQDLRREFGLSILLISHDLGVVARLCDRVSVMYLGKIVESGPSSEVFKRPRHPYTEALLQSIKLSSPTHSLEPIISGDVPSQVSIPTGCRFHPRCIKVLARCSKDEPHLKSIGELKHFSACWLPNSSDSNDGDNSI